MTNNQNIPSANQPPGSMGIPEEEIYAILGLQDLPENEKKMLLEKIGQVIQGQVINLIVSQLSDEQCQELNEKMDKGMNQWEVIEYLRVKIPNLDQQIRQMVMDFRDDLLKELEDIRSQIAAGKIPSSQPITKRFKEGYVKNPVSEKQTQNIQATTQSVPAEAMEYFKQLDKAIEQATKEKNFEQLMTLMNQRKDFKKQWGINE